ncbi:hypothetical protein G6F46_006798 [Rhizopus delemar]|uniref:Uncharacterized protein n=3 Tax=Rhizopus TaxID=4842 RepID=I1CFH6_RHIO9|nr:hypothetical protein RO3G_11917 [Rhizopus delemar RA 99-880]KAG1496442.1 hypothetical protein G6F54_006471 [Rhizopus delemar]KAG1506024.1 hypothetical protein G6F52_012005 [Rhizopus delemar]KAG1511289.1 hypothetical protein G6F53_006050 [Rhizopus delemar]KAG1568928.1 hypothetical protein G6F50_006846 [Rhizopus delemar]|eukprot:EIE87206.1 hypothetical protein RO3G_11917 [Rhizopus delemar RA 99-880]
MMKQAVFAVKDLVGHIKNVMLRWPDKSALEQSQGRTDAIISQIISNEFGECKTSDDCTNAALCFDTMFYVANLSNEGMYTFSQLAMMRFPRSVEDLPKFVNMTTITQLLQASQCF